MRKADRDHGFLICFLLNLAFNLGWGVIALLLLLGHYFFRIPAFLSMICFGIWILESLVITSLLSWGNHCGEFGEYEKRAKNQVNKNPYSAKNSDLPHMRKFENKEHDDIS